MCGNCLSFSQTTFFHFKPSFPIVSFSASCCRDGVVYGTGTETVKKGARVWKSWAGSSSSLGGSLNFFLRLLCQFELYCSLVLSLINSMARQKYAQVSVTMCVQAKQTRTAHSPLEVTRARDGALVPTCLGIPEDLYKRARHRNTYSRQDEDSIIEMMRWEGSFVTPNITCTTSRVPAPCDHSLSMTSRSTKIKMDRIMVVFTRSFYSQLNILALRISRKSVQKCSQLFHLYGFSRSGNHNFFMPKAMLVFPMDKQVCHVVEQAQMLV